jgi:hypothetical protein
VSIDNSKWSPRRAEPGEWLLRGLVRCGTCGVGTNCHKMQGRNGTWHRYYYCRNHDPIRAGGEGLRCRERNIRADALDRFVFDQIKDVLLHPDLLVSGERAVTVSTPIPDDELLAAELARLDRKIDAAEAERRRLVDIYQAGLIELTDLQRRAAEVAARLRDLRAKQASLAQHRATLARDNQLRRRVHDFAGRIRGIIDRLDDAQKQHLCRLLIEQVRVTGWHVEIRLRIPLDPEPGKPATDQPAPAVTSVKRRRFALHSWPSTAPATASKTASPSSPEVNHDMITLPRPAREVVPRPTREVYPHNRAMWASAARIWTSRSASRARSAASTWRATTASGDGNAVRAAATSRSTHDRRTRSPRWPANRTNRATPSIANRCGSANSAATKRPTWVPNTSGRANLNPGKQRSSWAST